MTKKPNAGRKAWPRQPAARRNATHARNKRDRQTGKTQTKNPDGCPKPTLSQTWTVNESRSAMCVQSVDVHVSCSSHYDAQLAAFFIDPRAK